MKRRRWWANNAAWLALGLSLVLGVAAADKPAATDAPLRGVLAPDFRAMAARAGPAVVGVEVVGMRTLSADASEPDEETPELPFRGRLPFHGMGSGFIISPDGLILTSAHVVQGARRVTVHLSDQRQLRAEVLGTDTITDVAVLRIPLKGLPVLKIGRLDRLRVGDPVMAIGSPFGMEQSVSHGIVSALRRPLPGRSVVSHIQTDAPVNQGHSGGPLLDASARVVGLHSQIYTFSGGYQGISFAIPIDVAMRVKDEILTKGHMLHGSLGVTIQDLDGTLAKAFGFERARGALVSAVDPDSAAEKAGLRAGDVITAFNHQPIAQAGDLLHRVGLAAPDEQVRLAVWRARKTHAVVVQLDRAMGLDDRSAWEALFASGKPQELGWRLRPLTEQERSLLGVANGLLLEEVSALTAQTGLRAGDALLSINLVPVHSVEEVHEHLRARPLNAALLVYREGEQRFYSVAVD